MLGVFINILISIGAVVMRRRLAAASILIRTITIGIAGTILFFTSELTLVKLQYRNHPAYVEAYVNYREDPQNPNLRDALDLEYNRVWMREEEFKEYEKSLTY